MIKHYRKRKRKGKKKRPCVVKSPPFDFLCHTDCSNMPICLNKLVRQTSELYYIYDTACFDLLVRNNEGKKIRERQRGYLDTSLTESYIKAIEKEEKLTYNQEILLHV